MTALKTLNKETTMNAKSKNAAKTKENPKMAKGNQDPVGSKDNGPEGVTANEKVQDRPTFTKEELEATTEKDLRAFCNDNEINLHGRDRHEDIVATILAWQEGKAEDGEVTVSDMAEALNEADADSVIDVVKHLVARVGKLEDDVRNAHAVIEAQEIALKNAHETLNDYTREVNRIKGRMSSKVAGGSNNNLKKVPDSDSLHGKIDNLS
jgi:hypothetical protein